jgi:transglutaminase-like putative cysteine protease
VILASWLPFPTPTAANRVSFVMHFTITAPQGSEVVELGALIPTTQQGRQRILNTCFSHPPANTFELDGSAYAHFILQNPAKVTEISITVDAEIYSDDLGTALAALQSSARIQLVSKAGRPCGKCQSTGNFLVSETYLEKDAPEIRAVAAQLLGQSEEETVRNTLAFVASSLKKGPFDSDDHGALWALSKRQGDCTEFADLFIALCRANNLPARFCQGYLLHDVLDGDTPKHDWAEVYLADHGWVPFDPFHVHLGCASAEKMRAIYVYLDNQRQNSLFDGGHYYAYRYQGGPVQVHDSFTVIRRQPVHNQNVAAVPVSETRRK